MTDVDISEIPNFEALESYMRQNMPFDYDKSNIKVWIDKLHQWCHESLAEGERLEKANLELQAKEDDLLADLHHALTEKESLEELAEQLADVKRGVRSFEEVMESIS